MSSDSTYGRDSDVARSLFDVVDEAPLTFRYWSMLAAVALAVVVEFFDFFLISFVVSIVAPQWSLTFGQVSVVLLSAGVGAIVGSLLAGRVGDRAGRRPLLLIGICVFSLGTGALALAPEGGWWFLAIMRFFVGAAVGGLFTGAIPLVIEFTPTRYRTLLGGSVIVLLPLGSLLAAFAGATLAPVVGWRGVCLVGLLPILLVVWVWISVPESPRWLVSKGRAEKARLAVAYIFRVPVSDLPARAPEPASAVTSSYRELFAYRGIFWANVVVWFGITTAYYGIALWGPTVLQLLLDVTPARAASLFILVILAGLLGRVFFMFIPMRLGRRASGILMGFAGAALLLGAALFKEQVLLGVPLLLAFLIAGAFFTDGGFVNCAAYFPELHPTHLRSLATGVSQASNGLGKIMGPLVLGLIAGTGNLVSPEATRAAVAPAFVFLAACSLLAGITFVLLRTETHGRTLDDEMEVAGAVAVEDEVVKTPGSPSGSERG